MVSGCRFIGFENYRILLFGSEQSHILGVLRPPSVVGWLIFAIGVAPLLWWIVSEARSGKASLVGMILRVLVAALAAGMLLIVVATFAPQARPGTLVVTLVYVAFGISFQYLLGLGLAYLATQRLVGRRFFRVIFLLPMMITPVGVAYMFRMLTDTQKGPFHPIFTLLGRSQLHLGEGPVGGADRRYHERRLAVDAFHVHRAARGPRSAGCRDFRGGPCGRGEPLGDFPPHHPARASSRSAPRSY